VLEAKAKASSAQREQEQEEELEDQTRDRSLDPQGHAPTGDDRMPPADGGKAAGTDDDRKLAEGGRGGAGELVAAEGASMGDGHGKRIPEE
jgi:hypothetical protein